MVVNIKQLNEDSIITYTIKGSKFIACSFKLNNIEDVNKYVEKVKNEYKGATHYCYAYVYDNIYKYEDDGEPSKTAGYPMLNVLLKNDITNTLVVIVRYFGGTLLGTGGLIRAYSKGVIDTIATHHFSEYLIYNKYEIEFSYSSNKQVDYLLKDMDIISKEFLENIVYVISTTLEYDELFNILNEYVISIKEIN